MTFLFVHTVQQFISLLGKGISKLKDRKFLVTTTYAYSFFLSAMQHENETQDCSKVDKTTSQKILFLLLGTTSMPRVVLHQGSHSQFPLCSFPPSIIRPLIMFPFHHSPASLSINGSASITHHINTSSDLMESLEGSPLIKPPRQLFVFPTSIEAAGVVADINKLLPPN